MARMIPGHPVKVTLEDDTVVMVPQDPSIDLTDIVRAKKVYARRAIEQNEAYKLDKAEADDKYEANKNSVHAAVGDEIYGAGETLAATASGIFGGLAGRAYGIVAGEEAGVEAQEAMTYKPRSRSGQRNVDAISETMEDSKLEGIPPVMPFPRGLGRSGAITRKKIKSKELPTRTQVKEAASKAYKEAQESGAVIKTSEFAKFANRLNEALRKKGYRGKNPDLGTIRTISEELNVLSKKKGGVTLDDLQDFRELANAALRKPDGQVNMLANTTTHALDDFLENVTPQALKKGDTRAFAKWRQGRRLWGQQAKIKEMEWLQEKAGLKDLKNKNSKGEAVEKFRGEINTLLQNPKKLKMYSLTDQANMRKFVDGGKMDGLLGGIATLAPNSLAGFGMASTIPLTAIASGVHPAFVAAASAGAYTVGKGANAIRNKRISGRGESMIDSFKIGGAPDAKYGVNLNTISTTPLTVGAGLLDDVYDQYNGTADKIEEAEIDF